MSYLHTAFEAGLPLQRSGVSDLVGEFRLAQDVLVESTTVAAAPSRSFLERLSDDAFAAVLQHLGSVDQLLCACVCTTLRDVVARSWEDSLLLSADAHRATDQLLLRLTLGRMARGFVRVLDIAGCELLSKAAVTSAAMAQRTIQELNGTGVGPGSWTPEQLLRLIKGLHDLKVLQADCRARGASSPLLRLLANPAVRLRKLVLHRPGRGDAAEAHDLGILAAALKRKPAGGGEAPESFLHDVDLAQSGGGLDGGFEFVARLLSGDECQVRRLALCGTRAPTVEALAALGAALESNRHLEHLSLGCNFISQAGGRALAAAVAAHPTLRSLSLEHNPVQDGGVAALATALCGPGSRLESLSLSFTGAKDGACRAIGSILTTGAPLQLLDLGGNLVSAEGAAALAEALAAPSGCALRVLNLSANSRIGAAGALALSAALPSSRLRELRLAGCGLGSTPCGRIAAAVARSSLETLDLSHNQIGDCGAWDLAWALAEPRTRLVHLLLQSNDIEDDGAAELVGALSGNTALELLDLSGNVRIDPDAEHSAACDRRVKLGFQPGRRKKMAAATSASALSAPTLAAA